VDSVGAIARRIQQGGHSAREGGQIGAGTSVRVASLVYHDVVAAASPAWNRFSGYGGDRYSVDEREFRQHLQLLGETLGHAPATVDEVLRGTAGASPWLLTFDDGCRSAANTVAECLDELKWRAHFFVPTGWIGWSTILSSEQIRSLCSAGHVVGTHSASHSVPMTRYCHEKLVDEWRRSSEALGEILGEPVVYGSIPGGGYSRKVAAAAAKAGLKALFTSEPSPHSWEVDGCHVFGRYCYRRGMAAETMVALASGDLWPRVRELLAWNSKKMVKRIGGALFYRVHRYLVGRQRRQ